MPAPSRPTAVMFDCATSLSTALSPDRLHPRSQAFLVSPGQVSGLAHQEPEHGGRRLRPRKPVLPDRHHSYISSCLMPGNKPRIRSYNFATANSRPPKPPRSLASTMLRRRRRGGALRRGAWGPPAVDLQHRPEVAADDPQHVCVAGCAVAHDGPQQRDPMLGHVVAGPVYGAHVKSSLESSIR